MQLSSKNAWPAIKCIGAGAFRNLVYKNVKTPHLLRVIMKRMTLIACKYDAGSAKFRLE